jgi:hypothetical protein
MQYRRSYSFKHARDQLNNKSWKLSITHKLRYRYRTHSSGILQQGLALDWKL